MAYLGLVGGGTFGSRLIAPNDLNQLIGVITKMRDVEMDPFFQVGECTAAMLISGSGLRGTMCFFSLSSACGGAALPASYNREDCRQTAPGEGHADLPGRS